MESDEPHFDSQDSFLSKFEKRMEMLKKGVRERVHISHSQEIDLSIIVRAVQMRYDRCSAKHIASVLGLEEDIVSSILQKDQEILKEYIDRADANDKLDVSRIPRTLNDVQEQIKEFGQWAFSSGQYDYSLEVLHLPTKREVADYKSKNFLKERLDSITNYRGLPTTTFSWIQDKPFVYELALIDKHRVYHLVRKVQENSMSFIGEKCWQLFHEGFSAEEIDEIFERPYASDFKNLAKHIDLEIDRRHNSIQAKPIKKTKSKTDRKFEESLHIINNSHGYDTEFYMNIIIGDIKTGNRKVKSIRSILKSL